MFKADRSVESVNKVKAFAEKELCPMFADCEKQDDFEGNIYASLTTTAQLLQLGIWKPKLEDYAGKKRDGDDEGAKPAAGGETGGKKRQKQGKDESEDDFLKRACCEAAEEFLNTFVEFGMSEKQAKKAVRLCVGGFIDCFDLEASVFAELMGKLVN